MYVIFKMRFVVLTVALRANRVNLVEERRGHWRAICHVKAQIAQIDVNVMCCTYSGTTGRQARFGGG